MKKWLIVFSFCVMMICFSVTYFEKTVNRDIASVLYWENQTLYKNLEARKKLLDRCRQNDSSN